MATLCGLLSCSLNARAECSKAAVCQRAPVAHRAPPRSPSESSSGVLVTGIVLGGLGLVSLVAGAALSFDRGMCRSNESYQHGWADCPVSSLEPAAWIGGGILIGVSVPMIIIGARRPATRAFTPAATVSTWANASGAGLRLRLEL